MNTQQRMTLLGTGVVGSAVVKRLRVLNQRGLVLPPLAAIGNSRGYRDLGEGDAESALDALRSEMHARLPEASVERSFGHGDIVVDATASAQVADCHARWLRQGAHVVTACKIAQGTGLGRWERIQLARGVNGAGRYGDSATVCAGLPVLRAIRRMRTGGDTVHAVAGILSGSLAWILANFDGAKPFSALVREALACGYTEPDPRDDLCGEDVRRKLLIIARTAGHDLEENDVLVESLVPASLKRSALADALTRLEALDAPLQQRLQSAREQGGTLAYIARLEHGRARAGLEVLERGHPLAGGQGTDNRVAIWCDRYAAQPMVLQGPGAGAEVTAAALIDDVLALA